MKILLSLLITFLTFTANADSSTTIYECSSGSASISEAYLDEVGGPYGANGEIVWDYTLTINWYNHELEQEEPQKISTGAIYTRAFEPGKTGYAIFGDRSKASHGVIPNSTIVAKNKFDGIQVVIGGDTYALSCVAKTQADL